MSSRTLTCFSYFSQLNTNKMSVFKKAKKEAETPKDKTYRLLNGAPLSYSLPSRNHPKFPLLWFDEEKGENRALRYASNQNSPFEDEQDGNAILEPILFEDGMLHVPYNRPALQKMLSLHPLNGVVFVEVDKEKDAEEEIVRMDIEDDAVKEAREMSLSQLEMVYRVIFGKDPSKINTAELKRDVRVYAKNNPSLFLGITRDPELKHQANVRMFFEEGLLSTKNNEKDIWITTDARKEKLISVPFGETPQDAACRFLMSEDGIEILKSLDAIAGK